LKIIRNFGPIITSDILSSILGGVFWLYLATLLTVENYGELQYFISIASMAAAITLIANNNSIVVYEIKKRNLTSTLFLISFLISGLVFIILFFLYSRSDIVLLTFGIMVGEMMIGYTLGKKIFVKYAFYIILQKILMILLGIGFYFYFGIEGVIFGIALSYIPLSGIIFRGLKESKIDFVLFKNNFGFIINNYSTKIIGFSKKHLDKIFIAPILGFEVLGEFALGLQMYMIMVLFANISFKFLLVMDANETPSKKLQLLVFLTSIIISILGITLSPIIIPMYFHNYVEVIEIIPILSLSVIPYTVGIIFTSKFLGVEKSKFPLIGTIIHIGIYLLLVIVFGLTYGLMGLGFSFLISSIVYALFLVITYYTQK